MTLEVLQTLYSILAKVTVQVGTPTFAEDVAKLIQAKYELENELKQYQNTK